MKFVLLIDYANLFINIKKNNEKVYTHTEVEQEIKKIIHALKAKLVKPNQYSKKGITIIKAIAFVLDNNGFGKPENSFTEDELVIKRVKSVKKDESMKLMSQSQDDDDVLMKEGLAFVESGQADGVLVISNDGDFVSLGEKVQYVGRYFWVGVHEGVNRAAYHLRQVADVVLPLHEIVKGDDEGIALPVGGALQDEQLTEISGPHLAIYFRGKMILRYPIKADKPKHSTIEIGRRSSSRFHYPQVDLTDHDLEKIVSRQHAKLQIIGGRLLFSVHRECSRGTWKNGIRVYPCEQFFLEPGMQIVVGNNKGFGIQYIAQ